MADFFKLQQPFLQELENEPVKDYRLAYRRFRSGHWEGARGEATGAVAQPAAALSDAGGDDDIEDFTVFGDSSGQHDTIHQAINGFRLHYRRYRQGEPDGAKGETSTIAAQMSYRVATSLPVAQLQKLVRHKSVLNLPAPLQSKFHVHLGAGRLGLGLVIPSLAASGRPFAILQRPSGAWKQLTSSGATSVTLKVNGGERAIKFALIVNGTGAAALTGDLPVFAVTDDVDVVKALVQRAQSYSTSLGPGLSDTVMGLVKGLPMAEVGVRPALYACENDHAAVEKLGEELQGRVDVVNCMVDRICTERTIGSDYVGIGTEPHTGEVVVITPPYGAPLPPLGGDHIRWPMLEAEAEYWCQRKILMVNGMHTCLAFMTLCKREPGGLNGDAWKDHSLLTMATATDAEQRRMWVWAVARCLFITWQHEPEIIKSAHGTGKDGEMCKQLLAYARATLSRFSTVEDKVGRVLGGGVANRWNGRLKMINDWLVGEPGMGGGLRGEMLKQAGVGEAEMRSEITRLVTESQRFVGLSVRRQSIIVT